MVNKQFANAVYIMTSLALSKKNNSKKLSPTGSAKISGQMLNQISGQMSSEQLAQGANTNSVVIRRLICQLTKSGLIQTSRGKLGGVSLAKETSEITLKDIYVALKLSEAISHNDKPTHKECPISCATHQVITVISEGAENALTHYLESQKLSDLIKKIK